MGSYPNPPVPRGTAAIRPRQVPRASVTGRPAARPRDVGQRQGQHADIAGAAAHGWQACQGFEQLAVVVGVGGVLAGVAPGPDAGTPVQRVHLDPGVVGQGRQAARPGAEPGFQGRVRLEGLAVLDRVAGDPDLVERDQLGAVEVQQLAEFAQLVGRARGDEQARTSHRPTA